MKNQICLSKGKTLRQSLVVLFTVYESGSESMNLISIPSLVEVMGSEGFSKCHFLASLTFEWRSKLARIENETFFVCLALDSVWIPSSVQVIESQCFRDCSSISSRTFESDSKLTRIETQTFSYSDELKSLYTPESIRNLENDWYDESSLVTVILLFGFDSARCR
jgi:hypothetical protein